VRHLDAVEAGCDERRHERAHARAAADVDGDAQLLERAHEPDVREPAGAPAAQHEPDAAGGHLPGQRSELRLVPRVQEVVGARARLCPPGQRVRRRVAVGAQQDELDRRATGAHLAQHRQRSGRGGRLGEDEHAVGVV
jgi:hypothetical protein